MGSDHTCNTCGYSWSGCYCPPEISDRFSEPVRLVIPDSPVVLDPPDAFVADAKAILAENRRSPVVRVEFRKNGERPVNFGWPGYDFYGALKIIHRYLPCGVNKDKDILVPSNFQFESRVHYAQVASFDVAVMRFCERSWHNPTKGDIPSWRIYPTVVDDSKLIGFEYMPINTELT